MSLCGVHHLCVSTYMPGHQNWECLHEPVSAAALCQGVAFCVLLRAHEPLLCLIWSLSKVYIDSAFTKQRQGLPHYMLLCLGRSMAQLSFMHGPTMQTVRGHLTVTANQRRCLLLDPNFPGCCTIAASHTDRWTLGLAGLIQFHKIKHLQL